MRTVVLCNNCHFQRWEASGASSPRINTVPLHRTEPELLNFKSGEWFTERNIIIVLHTVRTLTEPNQQEGNALQWNGSQNRNKEYELQDLCMIHLREK